MSTNACGTADILLALGFAVFIPEDDGTLVPLGELPAWWVHIDPEGGRRAPCFRPSSRHVFLAHFLQDAQAFFESGQVGACDSGIWELQIDEDTRFCLQIRALRWNEGGRVLVIQDLAASGIDLPKIIQRGRDSHMRLLHDLAEREQLEQELRRAQNASDRLNRAKTELLGKVSHELRTPLTSILGMAELALASTLEEPLRSYVAAIEQSGRYLQRLVADLLDTARLESGTLSIQSHAFDLAELISTMARDARSSAALKGLAFHLQFFQEDFASREIRGDMQRIRQVLMNLIENAIRYTHAGEVALSVAFHPSEEENIRFIVRDTGPGIPEEEQPFLFEPFVRSREVSPTAEGAGLGLSIVSKLVARMSGAVHLQSQLGIGSTFTIDLPLIPSRQDPADPTSPTSSMSSDVTSAERVEMQVASIPPAPSQAKAVSRMILIAEDNALNRDFLRITLGRHGHRVIEACDGEEAIPQSNDATIDVLLLDCQMPRCDGLEAAARIRARERITGAYLPMIAITANATPFDLDRCRLAGMDGFLTKPYTSAQLLEAIDRVVDRKVVAIRTL